jgi:hypothetical protein
MKDTFATTRLKNSLISATAVVVLQLKMNICVSRKRLNSSNKKGGRFLPPFASEKP